MSKFRVLLLADINSSHTQKWALGLAAQNIEIGIFSFNHSETNWYINKSNICCLRQKKHSSVSDSNVNKLSYIFYWPLLLYHIIKFRPHVIHAHYASSYGLLGALANKKQLIVSAWGSDVMDFPKRGLLQRSVLKFVFRRTQKICATSNALQKEIEKYTTKPSTIIPFGINLEEFYRREHIRKASAFTFGCVKHFESIYNIDKVVIAFKMLLNKYPGHNLNLKLVGDGSQRNVIKQLINELNLDNMVELTGRVLHCDVPRHLNTFDVFINVSEYESFGVAVAEAMACKVPVIVSKSEGFRDLISCSESVIVTNSNSPTDIFAAMETYFLNAERRTTAINSSYAHVREKFNWLDNLKQMEDVYCDMTGTRTTNIHYHA